MSKHEKRNQAKYSSLFQMIKSLFQGKPQTEKPVYTHPTYLQQQKSISISVNDLSPQSRQSFDQLFDSLFTNVQSSKI